MITYEYGNPEADTVLIQPTGEHEMASLENEVREIEKGLLRNSDLLRQR